MKSEDLIHQSLAHTPSSLLSSGQDLGLCGHFSPLDRQENRQNQQNVAVGRGARAHQGGRCGSSSQSTPGWTLWELHAADRLKPLDFYEKLYTFFFDIINI